MDNTHYRRDFLGERNSYRALRRKSAKEFARLAGFDEPMYVVRLLNEYELFRLYLSGEEDGENETDSLIHGFLGLFGRITRAIVRYLYSEDRVRIATTNVSILERVAHEIFWTLEAIDRSHCHTRDIANACESVRKMLSEINTAIEWIEFYTYGADEWIADLWE